MSYLHSLGWTALHFLWQGSILALLCWALMSLSRSARVRYAVGCAGLLAMLLATAITFAVQVRARTAFGTDFEPPLALDQPIAEAMPIAYTPAATVLAEQQPIPQVQFSELIPWLGTAWVSGFILLALRQAIGLTQLSRIRRESVLLEESGWASRLNRLIRRFRLRRPISLLISHRIDCPAVVGSLKPVILWPAAALTGLTPKQVDALLAHELAHIARHDHLVNLLQVAIETLLFFHPCVWWLSRRIRQERENCCDDLAATVLGSKVEYAEALVAMESLRQAHVLSLSANGGSLMKRIQRLLEPTTPRQLHLRPAPTTLLLLAGVMTLSLWTSRPAPTNAEPATQPATAPADANSLGGLFAEVIKTRDALITLQATKSAFDPEVIQAQHREREATQTWMALLFDACNNRTEDEIETELKAIPEVAAPQSVDHRNQLRALLRSSLREARIQYGEDSVVLERLSKVYEKLRAFGHRSTRQELASRDPFFARLIAEADTAAKQLARLRENMGENAPMVKKLRDQLKLYEDRIRDIQAEMEVEADLEGEMAARRASEIAARIAEKTKLLLEKRDAIQLKIKIAQQTLSEQNPNLQALKADLDSIDASLRSMMEDERSADATARWSDAFRPDSNSPRNRAVAADNSLVALYRELAKDRETLVADIAARRADPNTKPEVIAELEGLLRTVERRIAGITNPVGEVYIGGRIGRPGVYSISGRATTLKQLLIAAGWSDTPEDVLIQIVRRDPATNKEEVLYRHKSDLFDKTKAIGSERGDLLLKSDDQIMVGVKPASTQPTTQPGI